MEAHLRQNTGKLHIESAEADVALCGQNLSGFDVAQFRDDVNGGMRPRTLEDVYGLHGHYLSVCSKCLSLRQH